MLVSCRFLLSGSYKDNRARRRERRRRSAPAAEPVVQRQTSRARKRGPQHTVGARGHSKTGQTPIVASWQNAAKLIFLHLFKRYWKPGTFFKGESIRKKRIGRTGRATIFDRHEQPMPCVVRTGRCAAAADQLQSWVYLTECLNDFSCF